MFDEPEVITGAVAALLEVEKDVLKCALALLEVEKDDLGRALALPEVGKDESECAF